MNEDPPRNQHCPVDPTSAYPRPPQPEQAQPDPGHAGAGRLAGRRAVDVGAPGPFWTPLQVTGGRPPERIPDFGGGAWLGRAGQPSEIAATSVHLVGAELSDTTGATLSVTGGSPTP